MKKNFALAPSASRALPVALALAGLCADACAQTQLVTPNTVKVGVTRYDAHSKTSGISGPGVPAGADAEVGDATTAVFIYERYVHPNVGIELVLGIPPVIHSKATGTVAFLGDNVLSARNVAPTLLVNYHFFDPTAPWRPYLGAGVNYTRFTNIHSSLAPKVEIADSTGLAVTAGLDYRLTPEWGLFASITKINVKSKLVATGATVLQTTIDFRPLVYTFGATYKF